MYFSNDLNTLICTIYGYPKCRKYFFYSQYLFDETAGSKNILHGNHTRVADILNKNGISYNIIDYSRNEQLLYEKSLTILDKLKQDFRTEGNEDLYESRLKETLLGKQLYDNGLASRFLYITE